MANNESRSRLTISLTTPAAKLVRRVAFIRGEARGVGPNVSGVLEELIRQHWDEFEREVASLGG